jgi:hypothetical protein
MMIMMTLNLTLLLGLGLKKETPIKIMEEHKFPLGMIIKNLWRPYPNQNNQ